MGVLNEEASAREELGALLPALWHVASPGKRRIPAWASSFIRLGAAAASARCDGERLVAAVAAPTRSYAATLAGVGAVTARAPMSFSSEQPSTEAIEAHFRLLSSLRPGTTVTVRTGRTKNVGTFERVDFSGDEPLIVISQKGFVQKYRKFGCRNISPTSGMRPSG